MTTPRRWLLRLYFSVLLPPPFLRKGGIDATVQSDLLKKMMKSDIFFDFY